MEEVTIRVRRPGIGGQHLRILLPAVFLFLAGCSFFNPPTFTEAELRGVDTTLTYQDVEREYRSMTGRKVMVGGRTVHLDNQTTRAFVQIVPAPLDAYFRPEAPAGEPGLLLLVFPYPVDPSAMADGRRVTVIGRVRRMRRPSLTEGGRTVRLVTIDVLALHTWVPATSLVGGSPYPVMTPGFTGPYQTP